MPELTISLKTLTPLWTGGVDQTCDRLHETGLIGSLRWWYEALVRGLGGYACDPTFEARCPDKDGNRCVACELFGCTGWSRKFRLRVADNTGKLRGQCLNAATDFDLRLVPLRLIREEEGWLLVKAVEIAARYGSVGGRTTRKPQAKKGVGDDYGLISLRGTPAVASYRDKAEAHLSGFRSVNGSNEWPDLRWFFFTKGGALSRLQINRLIGISENGKRIIGNEPYQQFLRGRRGQRNEDAKSKRVFSFRSGGGRMWGYARDRKMRDEIINHVKELLGYEQPHEIKTGEEVISEL
jgi:CRISPR-associated protein Cmr1